MNKKETALKILNILKREYSKYLTPVSTYFQEKTKDPFKVLIATILSPRAKDTQTEKVAKKLFEKADTPEKIIQLSQKELEKIVYSIGFYKVKAKRVKEASRHLLEHHRGNVPQKREELLSIPGVGRKVANIILAECFNIPSIAVDTHVTTISNRLGFVKGRNPSKVEKTLEKLFPKKQWKIINKCMVVYGQNICTPLLPRCSICSINKLCPKIGVIKSR